jgi:hypothetical protein
MTTTLERERIRKRRAAARERGRKLVEAARARARKLVEVARARARTLLEVASRPRVRLVVKEAKPSTKRRTKATPKPKPKVRPVKPAPSPDYESAFLTALRKVAGGSRGLISIGDVRSASGLPKSVFDALALRLMRERRLVLHEHDFPQSLSAAKRADLVEDAKGRVFVGMALPLLAAEPYESKLLNKARLYGAGAPVRIASLRKDVGLTPREFDLALGALQRLGKVALYRDDNRATAKDEGAYFLAGEPRHILYVR